MFYKKKIVILDPEQQKKVNAGNLMFVLNECDKLSKNGITFYRHKSIGKNKYPSWLFYIATAFLCVIIWYFLENITQDYLYHQ